MSKIMENLPDHLRPVYDSWGAVKSITDIKDWLRNNLNSQMFMCLMAQLDAIYVELVRLGLDEVTTGAGVKPTHTRDGLVVKFILAINFIQEDMPLAYEILMTPDDKGQIIKFETTYGRVPT